MTVWNRSAASGTGQSDECAVWNSSKAVANTDMSGNWKAVLTKNGSTFDTYFTFEVSGDKLFGKVIYPTGEAGILNGTIGNGQFSFITRHTPQFADQEATITVDGRISGDEIEIVMQDDNGFAKGVAHRVAQSGSPKAVDSLIRSARFGTVTPRLHRNFAHVRSGRLRRRQETRDVGLELVPALIHGEMA